MKNELDKILKTTYHSGNVPTDYLNQTVLRNVRECEHMRQSKNNDKKIKMGHGSSMKKFARVAAIILFLGCAGYIGASAAGYVKPISEVFRFVFHGGEDTAELADSMGHFVGEAQIQDGVKITENAVIGDGSTYATVFDIEKEDGTAFDFAKDMFDENGIFKVGSDGTADKWVQFKSFDEKAPADNYSSSSYFYDADPTDSSIQMVTIYEFDRAKNGQSLTQIFTDFELYDVEKDDASVIAKGTWEFTYSLNCDDLSKTVFENQDATIGLLSATQGSCVVSPLKYTLQFAISKDDYDTNYKEKDEADENAIGPYALSCDIKSQGIYLNLKNGEKMDMSKSEVHCGFDDDGSGNLVINKLFNKIVPVENIESISIGNQTIKMNNK